MTSEARKCIYCLKKFPEDEILCCTNCNRVACTDCVDEHEKDDERECDCEHLCADCREGPSECKSCFTKGCALCMGAGCECCTDKKKHVGDLVCDDCCVTCDLCKKERCKEHTYRCSNTEDSDDEDRCRKICSMCMKKLMNSNEPSNKKRRSASPEAAELTPLDSK